ncbi:substrate-binding periplasmic protein [Aeromonas sanarellii]|uniref:substrate-binding periplasmic protein n=1 Tax=Aeromonas sanarellii TaxID=633415 RepID=UPI0005AA7ABF|nr:transporter substrate-binding domain-containing protein [Aeromonas sanarellii]
MELGIKGKREDIVLMRLFKALSLFICLGGQGFATELKIVVSQYTPPYVFEDGSGILLDIVRTALAEGGYQVKPIYVPIERGFRMFADRQVDGTTIIQESSGLQAEYSDYFMQYHNRAFVLKSSQQVIHRIADLGGKSVIAFQYAERYLGEEFARAVAGNPRYKELAQQQSQVHMLLLGRIDVAIMDESIFRYYHQKLIAERQVEPGQEVISYDIFPPTRFKAAFTDPAVRDGFDKAIALMRKDGRYEAIYRKYTERYFSVEP